MNTNLKCLIIPHINKIGGAGIYIEKTLVTLQCAGFDIEGAGRFAKDYAPMKESGIAVGKSEKFVFPLYSGSALVRSCIYLILSLFKALGVKAEIRKNSDFVKGKIVILTSSIQAPLAFFFKRIVPECKIVMLVQENVKLRVPFLSKLFLFLIKDVDLVISITDSWALAAREQGINSVVIRNTYSPRSDSVTNDSSHYDLLYVGGESRLKGFDFIVSALSKISHKTNAAMAFVGLFSEASIAKVRKELERKNIVNVKIEFFPYSSDLTDFYRRCDIVILPIQAPHFCRPAIEAGCFRKTFIVTGFKDISDFAVSGENCLTFTPGSQDSFSDCIARLVHDKALREQLGKKNYDVYVKSFSESRQADNLVRCFLTLM